MTITPDANNVAQIIQKDCYYPYGMKIAGLSYVSGAENKYTYNGKELIDEFGLNWYHYGARYYDPQLGRGHSIDPAEQFASPYTYCGNNPIMMVDPDGKKTIISFVNGICTGLNSDNYAKDNYVYYNVNGKTSIAGLQPPIMSYLYSKNKTGASNVIGYTLSTDWTKEINNGIEQARQEIGQNIKNIAKWGTNKEYDFKRNHNNEIGTFDGMVGTGRDGGNHKYGKWVATYSFLDESDLGLSADLYSKFQAATKKTDNKFEKIFNVITANEDIQSSVMQHEGYGHQKQYDKGITEMAKHLNPYTGW